jgi:hypothetical protein
MHDALVGAGSMWPTLDALNSKHATLQHKLKVEKENKNFLEFFLGMIDK